MSKIKNVGELILIFIAVISFIGLFMVFPFGKGFGATGNVVYDEAYNHSIGDKLSENVYMSINENVDSDTAMIISLSKDGRILKSETMTLRDFVRLSNGNADFSAGLVPEGGYSVRADKIISYQFSEIGEYELYYAVLKIGLARRVEISVK